MDEQLQAILQEQLRDVHLPEPITWWPLAIGWWLVIALAVVTIVGLSYYLIKRFQANRYRQHALTELNTRFANWQAEKNDADYLQQANEILKRTVATLNHQALNQSGQAWATSLNQLVKTPLSDTSQRALAYECYRANPQVDVTRLHKELCVWLKQHTPEVSHV